MTKEALVTEVPVVEEVAVTKEALVTEVPVVEEVPAVEEALVTEEDPAVVEVPAIVEVPTVVATPLQGSSQEFRPVLYEIYLSQLNQVQEQLNQVYTSLPVGIDIKSQVRQVIGQLEELSTLLDPSLMPFSEAIVRARQVVAPLTPADFSLHINDQTGDLEVSLAFIEAFKVAFLALVTADEVDWLHIDFINENGRLKVSSDPPLKRYLNASSHWTQKMAIDVLGLD